MATQNFSYTGAVQEWEVPAGVTEIQVDMAGARGGRGGTQGSDTGLGGRVQATLAVTPGHTLYIYVGGVGADKSGGNGGAGGFNGGGEGGDGQTGSPGFAGAGGGGASDIRDNADTLAARKLVAGGGGGLATNGQIGGGDGGDTTANDGDVSGNSPNPALPGGGGTPSAGGIGGDGHNAGAVGADGADGALGVGGAAGAGVQLTGRAGGGGGGGGYYGGGGGGSNVQSDSYQGCGGGGGSSYSDPTDASGVTHTKGFQDGAGYVNLTYQPQFSITKSLGYAIGKTFAATKSLQYAVQRAASVTKGLQYTVKDPQAVTRSAQYTVLTTPAPDLKTLDYMVEQRYSRQANAALPTVETDLSTAYQGDEYADVGTDDDVLVGIEGSVDDYLAHLFRFNHFDNNTDPINVRWRGQSEKAPSESAVILEIWNFDTAAWEELDRNDTAAEDTEFELAGSITSGMADYYGPNNRVAARVYQLI